MTTDYLVIAQCPCPDCRGAGDIDNPLWVNYKAAMAAWRESANSGFDNPDYLGQHLKAQNAFWMECGFDVDDLPPERLPCVPCQGTGILRRECGLQDALADLGVVHEPVEESG